MSRSKPPNYHIPAEDPENHNKVWDIDVKFFASPGAGGVPVVYHFQRRYKKVGGTSRGWYRAGFICGVPGDAVISLSLASPGCRWSKSVLAVTGKADYSGHLGGIKFRGNKVVFKVKKNTSGSPLRHFLNLNVEFFQGKTEDGTEIWVGQTIDPDVINPRPPEGFLPDDKKFSTRCIDENGLEEELEIVVSIPKDEEIPFAAPL